MNIGDKEQTEAFYAYLTIASVIIIMALLFRFLKFGYL